MQFNSIGLVVTICGIEPDREKNRSYGLFKDTLKTAWSRADDHDR